MYSINQYLQIRKPHKNIRPHIFFLLRRKFTDKKKDFEFRGRFLAHAFFIPFFYIRKVLKFLTIRYMSRR